MALQVACEQFIAVDDIECDCGDTQPEALAEMIDQASDILAILTGGKVAGRCTDVVRPCNVGSRCGCSALSLCGCSPIDGITLSGYNPVVDGITIDGSAFTEFTIVDGNRLVRTDGQPWPGTQDLSVASTEAGTFEVTYSHGLEIPYLAKQAASEIVCSFLQNDPQSSRKPHPNTRGMNISGVSITLDQMAQEIKRRSFMLPYVVRLLTVYAPSGPSPALVYSPELEDGWRLHTADPYGS